MPKQQSVARGRSGKSKTGRKQRPTKSALKVVEPRHSGLVEDFFLCEVSTYQPDIPIIPQLDRLKQHFAWTKKQLEKETDQLARAIVLQFSRSHGTDPTHLKSWQVMCTQLGARCPGSIQECKAVIKQHRFDIIDLALVALRHHKVPTYMDDVQLRARIVENGAFELGNHPLASPILKEISALKAPSESSTQAQWAKSQPNHAIAAYFARHPEFRYDPYGETMSQFRDMVDFFDWDEGKEGFERRQLRNALVEQFETVYGTDAEALEGWQELCRVMNRPQIYGSVAACKRALRQVYVNLVDLVDTGITGKQVELHPSEMALSEYTLRTEKVFPRAKVPKGSLLECLLRHIHNPRSKSQVNITEVMIQRQQQRRDARRAMRAGIHTEVMVQRQHEYQDARRVIREEIQFGLETHAVYLNQNSGASVADSHGPISRLPAFLRPPSQRETLPESKTATSTRQSRRSASFIPPNLAQKASQRHK